MQPLVFCSLAEVISAVRSSCWKRRHSPGPACRLALGQPHTAAPLSCPFSVIHFSSALGIAINVTLMSGAQFTGLLPAPLIGHLGGDTFCRRVAQQ